MEILRDIMYYGLPILVSLYVCGWLYPRLNPKDAPRGRVGLLYILACVAAVAAVKRELGSARAAAGVVLLQCGIAWVMAFLVHTVGTLLGFV